MVMALYTVKKSNHIAIGCKNSLQGDEGFKYFFSDKMGQFQKVKLTFNLGSDKHLCVHVDFTVSCSSGQLPLFYSNPGSAGTGN